jgi:D-threitol dehydrogenase (NAD+)
LTSRSASRVRSPSLLAALRESGAAIACAFVAKGARVALVDRDIDTACAHARNLEENARAFQCDVADPSSAENSVHSVLTEFGHVDVLVNCAGVVVVAPAEDLTSHMWDTTLAVNLAGTFLMSQQVGRAMLEAGGVGRSHWAGGYLEPLSLD